MLLIGAAPASAHAHLSSSDPAEGAVLAGPPAAVTLTFSEPLRGVAGIRIDRAPEATVPATGPTLTVPLAPLPAGEHAVTYRVTSADGHTVTGTLRFRIAASTISTPPAAPVTGAAPEHSSSGIPIWPFVAGGAVILAALVLLAVRRGRR